MSIDSLGYLLAYNLTAYVMLMQDWAAFLIYAQQFLYCKWSLELIWPSRPCTQGDLGNYGKFMVHEWLKAPCQKWALKSFKAINNTTRLRKHQQAVLLSFLLLLLSFKRWPEIECWTGMGIDRRRLTELIALASEVVAKMRLLPLSTTAELAANCICLLPTEIPSNPTCHNCLLHTKSN